jgi:hypothetical protein
MQLVRFKGQSQVYLLTPGGAIATTDDYENGRCGYAHLCKDGLIRRYHQVIGSNDDLEVVGEYEPKVDPVNMLRGILFDESWDRRLEEGETA